MSLQKSKNTNLCCRIILLALLCLPCTALGEAAPGRDVMLSPARHPAAETAFVPSLDELPPAQPDPGWYVRTGARKGLSGGADTEAELFLAPDTAVLARGFDRVWPGCWPGFRSRPPWFNPMRWPA